MKNTDTSGTRIQPCLIRVRIRSRVGHRHAADLPYPCFVGCYGRDAQLNTRASITPRFHQKWFLGAGSWLRTPHMTTRMRTGGGGGGGGGPGARKGDDVCVLEVWALAPHHASHGTWKWCSLVPQSWDRSVPRTRGKGISSPDVRFGLTYWFFMRLINIVKTLNSGPRCL